MGPVFGQSVIFFTLLCAVSGVPEDGLTALYNSLHGNGGWPATNWMTGSACPLGSWTGVACNGSRIVGLDLRFQDLKGSFPSQFGLLTDIVDVRVQQSNMTGSIPSQIASLTGLTRLVLSTNMLTGEFPQEIVNIPTLTTLRIGTNSFCGDLPINFTNIASAISSNNYFGTECCAVTPALPAGLTCSPTPAPSVYAECSSATCSDLGWDASLNGNGDTCAETDASPLSSCSGFMRWTTAKEFCQSVGARLCTYDELAVEDEGVGTGGCSPSYDTEYIWSSTSCGSSKYYAVYGGGSASQSSNPAVCYSISTIGTVRARCCADETCTFSPTLTPAPTLLPTLSHMPSLVPSSSPSTVFPTSSPTLVPTITSAPSPLPTMTVDAEVLRLLYTELGGTTSNWSTSTNWGLSSNPCSASFPWAGVTCASASHVSALDLNSFSLSGEMPSEIGLLSWLQKLDMGDNLYLSGSIPSQFGLLTAMTDVALDAGIGMFGTIPSQLGLLSQLINLDLKSSKYSGDIPSELGQIIATMTTMEFNNNNLTSSIPSELGRLSHLTYLQVQSNDLCGDIPVQVETIFTELLASAFQYEGQSIGTPCRTPSPTHLPTEIRTPSPSATFSPTSYPTKVPSTGTPTLPPTPAPTTTMSPTNSPTLFPTSMPSDSPTLTPTPLSNQQSGSGRVGNALSEWKFARSDCLSNGPFPNTGSTDLFGSIAINRTADVTCPNSNGIMQAASVVSSGGVTLSANKPDANLIDLSLTGMTFELWANFNNSQSASESLLVPIFILGQGNEVPSASQCGSSPWYDFAVYSKDGSLEVSVPKNYDSDGSALCTNTRATPLEFQSKKHLVFVVNGTGLYIYLDGSLELADDSFTSTELSDRWSLYNRQFRLQIFSAADVLSSVFTPMDATLYFTAFYGRALSSQEISQNYNAALINSDPVALDMNITVFEDGEVICGSDLKHPQKYRYPISPISDLATITFSVYDADNDVGHPNYNYELATNHPTKVKIASLPSRGSIYQTEGDYDEITAVGTFVTISNGTASVHYRPEKDAYSATGVVFDSFEVTAVDGITAEESLDTGLVRVFVTSCNDPPLARNGSTIALSATSTVVYLNATDIDDVAAFAQSYITSYPALSGAYLETWNGVQYVRVDSLPWAVGSTGLVAYTYNGTEDLPILDVEGTIAYDNFQFSVMDAHGANSSQATFAVTVRLPLLAEPSSQYFADDDTTAKLYTVYEATSGNISMFCADQSDKQRSVSLRIQSLPRHGMLFDPITGQQLFNGSLVNMSSTYPYEEPIRVSYIGNANYFNSPHERYNGTELSFQEGDDDDNFQGEGFGHADTFTFSTELTSDPSIVSLPVTQAVVVINVNDIPKLTSPKQFSTLAIGSGGDDDGDELIITGIKFSDADRDVDPVKVSISSQYGFISLNQKSLDKVDFNSFDVCYGHEDWSCSGDGDGDRTMLFVGQPSDVAQVLSSITYQTVYSYITDYITIAIYDGERPASFVGDDGADTCLEGDDFTSISRRGSSGAIKECFVVYANITIEVGEFANSDSTVNDEDIQDNTQLAVAAAVFVLFVLFCVLRVVVAKAFGWKLQGVPTGEEEWDSDEPSDEDFDEEEEEDDYSDDEDDLEGVRLKRRKSKRKSKRKSRRKSVMPTFAGVKKRASIWVGGGGGDRSQSQHGSRGLEMIDVTPNPVALESGVPVSPGRGQVASRDKGGVTGARVNVRKSIAQATTMQQLASSRNDSGGGAAVEEGGGDRGASGYHFEPSEWRRHKDGEGITFFHHIASGVTTYAMPWVLTPEDLQKPIHDANNPSNWRAVETGRKRKDGSPITMYYNTVTKQSTFDLPMFATW